MAQPFFLIWTGILVGVTAATWPDSYGVWFCVGALFWLGRAYKKLTFAALLLGGSRAALMLHFQGTVEGYDPEVHLYRLQIIQKTAMGSTAEIRDVDHIQKSNDLVSISGNFLVGDILSGYGSLQPLASHEYLNALPKERSRIRDGLIGRLKWIDKPNRVAQELSFRDRLREKIFFWLKTPLQPLDGLRRALVLGDSTGIPAEVWRTFNYLGLSHALVISGSHLSFLILIFAFFSRKLFRCFRIQKYFLTRVFLILVIGLFYFVCNRDSSLERAMLGFLFISAVGFLIPQLHRYPKTEALSVVGALMALWDPLCVMTPSYALSFGATWALVSAFEGKVRSLVLYPYFVVMPICFLFGFVVHPLSPLLNLIFLPLFFFILVPISFLNFSPFESLANTGAWIFFEGLEAIANTLQTHTPFVRMATVFAPVLLVSVVIVFQSKWSSTRKLALLTLLVFGFQFFTWISFEDSKPKPNPKTLQVMEVDVGDGDAFLLRMENLKIVVDGGGPFDGARQLFPALLNEFHNQIDLWVFTHFDRDHVSNFLEIRGLVGPREIWFPRRDESRISKTLTLMGGKPAAENELKLCSEHFCLLSWMDPKRQNLRSQVTNEDSVVLMVLERSSNEILALFAGDLFSSGEKALVSFLTQGHYDLKKGINLLKAAHHGSKTSSSDTFIRTLKPRVVILSSGRNNSYHHPHSIVLKRFEEGGAYLLRGDILGNFKVFFDF